MYGERERTIMKEKEMKRLKSSFVFSFFPLNNVRDAVSRGVRNKPSTNSSQREGEQGKAPRHHFARLFTEQLSLG